MHHHWSEFLSKFVFVNGLWYDWITMSKYKNIIRCMLGSCLVLVWLEAWNIPISNSNLGTNVLRSRPGEQANVSTKEIHFYKNSRTSLHLNHDMNTHKQELQTEFCGKTQEVFVEGLNKFDTRYRKQEFANDTKEVCTNSCLKSTCRTAAE